MTYIPNEYINVQDPAYGAVGDGTTDDTAAIQSALDVVGAKRVYFPAGTYRINAGRLILNMSNTELIGDGWGSLIIWNTQATDTPAQDVGMLNIRGTNVAVISKIAIRNLQFNFGGAKTDAFHLGKRGINIYNCNDIEITDCYFSGGTAEMVMVNNIDTGGCRRLLVSGCIFENFVQNGLNPNALYQVITNNIFRNGGVSSKTEIGGAHWSFTGNLCEDMTFGLDLSSVADFAVCGNTFKKVAIGVQFSNQTPGFPAYRGVISGNTFLREDATVSGDTGILMERGSAGVGYENESIAVSNNVISGYYRGIRMTSNIGGSLCGNIVNGQGVGTIGIECGSSSSVLSVIMGDNLSVNNTTDYSIASLASGEVVRGANTQTTGQLTAANTIDSTATTATLTGTTAETTLLSMSVPANTLPVGQGVKVFAAGSSVGAVGNKTVRLYIYNTRVATIPAFTAESAWQLEATMWRGAGNTQRWHVKGYVGSSLVLNAYVETAVSMTVAQTIALTGQLATSTETIDQRTMTLEKF